MSFAWPLLLLSLLAVPVLVAVYVWADRRRRRSAVVHSNVALIKAARPRRSAWRRHLPFALLVAALAALGVASARPQMSVAQPSAASSVILAFDVSGSMCATDVEPNRLSAAQAAVRDFVKRQDVATRIGLVVFSGFAQLAVEPTTDRGDLLRAVDSLTTGRGTTIGAAILKSVDAISQIDPDVAPATGASGDPSTGGTPGSGGSGATSPGSSPSGGSSGPGAARAPGSYAPEIVVLLTDGANTRGITPIEAAKVAAARGVRIFPIGFGTTHPTSMVCTAQQLGGSGFDSFRPGPFAGGFGGVGNSLVADEPTLRQVAAITGGAYFPASGADQLQDVLADLPRHVQVQYRTVELTALWVGLAAVLVLLSLGAAARWTAFPA
jgi:Ca-activated chloride channel homolog